MNEFDFFSKTANPTNKTAKTLSSPPTKDQLVRMLMSNEMAKPANASLRRQVIKILQEREGNAFVERLMGKSSWKALA